MCGTFHKQNGTRHTLWSEVNVTGIRLRRSYKAVCINMILQARSHLFNWSLFILFCVRRLFRTVFLIYCVKRKIEFIRAEKKTFICPISKKHGSVPDNVYFSQKRTKEEDGTFKILKRCWDEKETTLSYKLQKVLERTSSSAFRTLFNITVSVAFFN
jgi:hypothetical protein